MFYREFFSRINEDLFAVLYSDEPARPNVPVNVLVELEAIKAGFGWSDEELLEAFLYNLQVRFALGYDRLGGGEFEIRSLYNFRWRLSEYNLKHNVNLLEQAFAGITDQQIVELKICTGFQRMDSTQIASNILDASRLHLLVEGVQRLPDLKQRTDLHTLVTDGGFPSEANDNDLCGLEIRLIQTGIRGTKPDPNRFNLTDFQVEHDACGNPTCVTCPNAQSALATPGKTSGWFARFPAEACSVCPFQLNQRCRAKPQQRDPRYFIDFTLPELAIALRRKDYIAQKQDEHNLRAAVEAAVRSLKHPFPAGKLPVRGKFRMTCMLMASALHVNVRRIWRYQTASSNKTAQNVASLFSRLRLAWQNFLRFLPLASFAPFVP